MGYYHLAHIYGAGKEVFMEGHRNVSKERYVHLSDQAVATMCMKTVEVREGRWKSTKTIRIDSKRVKYTPPKEDKNPWSTC